MNKNELRSWFICSHQWAKELKERHKEINYRVQLSFCMRELLRQKKQGEHNLF